MAESTIPSEFRHLVQSFHQDIFDRVRTEEELVDHVVKLTPPQERVFIKRFLTDLLRRNPTGEELQHVWKSAGPDWGLSDSGLRRFLAMVRDKID